MTAAGWTWPSWAWPRWTPQETSMSPNLAPRSPAAAASSTSPRTPNEWCTAAPSPPAGWTWRWRTAGWPSAARGPCASCCARWSRSPSPAYAARRGQHVLYVTERAVFALTPEGVELKEIAPGVDLQRDILDQMDFQPIIRKVRAMDPRIFRPEPMGLTLP